MIVNFVVMFIVALLFNPMNILAYKIEHLYLSTTLIYTSLYMATNMIWVHELIHFLTHRRMNIIKLVVSLSISLCLVYLMRNQIFVSYKEWIKRMISHHSTALTTTTALLKNNKDFPDDPQAYHLAKAIIYNQKQEIDYMRLKAR